MRTNTEILPEDVKHYAELNYSLKRATEDYYKGNKENVEVFRGGDLETAFFPKGLSDEDKFAAELISMYSSEIGLTTKRLTALFGWSKYKCYKIARNCKYCRTVCLICEQGGYGGTGWMLSNDMYYAIHAYAKDNFPCAKCKHLVPMPAKYSLGRGGYITGYCKVSTHLNIDNFSGCTNGKFENKEENGNTKF